MLYCEILCDFEISDYIPVSCWRKIMGASQLIWNQQQSRRQNCRVKEVRLHSRFHTISVLRWSYQLLTAAYNILTLINWCENRVTSKLQLLMVNLGLCSTEDILKGSHKIFTDVQDDFSDVKKILSRFNEWRVSFPETYTNAYISLCLPKLLAPLIRHQLIGWNPLKVSYSTSSFSFYCSYIVKVFAPVMVKK